MIVLVDHHLVPCLLASGVLYLALRLLFGPGKLRRPGDRVPFLYVGLLKAALALWVGTSVSCLARDSPVFGYFGLRLPDLVPDGPPFEGRKLIAVLSSPDLAARVLIVLLVLGVVLLCYRWARIAPVYRGIYRSRTAEVGEFAETFQVFEELAGEAYRQSPWLPRPRLMLVWNPPTPAFTMGIRPPIVVLSAELARQLGRRELRGVLAHELGHIRHLDYVGRWLATILRDIMIWNPFVVLWHRQVMEEQERASDGYAAELLGDPAAVASGLIEISAHAQGLPLASLGPVGGCPDRTRALRSLSGRVGRLAGTDLGPAGEPKWPAWLLYPVLALFLLAQPHVVVSFPRLQALATGPR